MKRRRQFYSAHPKAIKCKRIVFFFLYRLKLDVICTSMMIFLRFKKEENFRQRIDWRS
jgi:hypothetical protein